MVRSAQSSSELCASLGVSQPQLSRYIKESANQIVKIRTGRSIRYCLRREIELIGNEISVYTISKDSKISTAGKLLPVYPKGFYWLATDPALSALYDDLPYFMNDLRPSGYLGRLIPRTHPEWNFPEDIKIWSAETTLRYLINFGTNLIGNLIIGDIALGKALKTKLSSSSTITINYDLLAGDIIKYGNPGSSAAGEQPKFITESSFVKFVNLDKNPVSIRKQDLLRAEQLAYQIYDAMEYRTKIFESGKYLFYEMQRFDRNNNLGRLGLISLASLDSEFCGIGFDWSKIASKLLELKLITPDIYDEVRLRQLFGEMIGNNDMHSGNLSFFFEQQKITGLAPSYDMLPMRYMPVHENINNDRLEMPIPAMNLLHIWDRAAELADKFWGAINTAQEFSSEFREIARINLDALSEIREIRKLQQ